MAHHTIIFPLFLDRGDEEAGGETHDYVVATEDFDVAKNSLTVVMTRIRGEHEIHIEGRDLEDLYLWYRDQLKAIPHEE